MQLVTASDTARKTADDVTKKFNAAIALLRSNPEGALLDKDKVSVVIFTIEIYDGLDSLVNNNFYCFAAKVGATDLWYEVERKVKELTLSLADANQTAAVVISDAALSKAVQLLHMFAEVSTYCTDFGLQLSETV